MSKTKDQIIAQVFKNSKAIRSINFKIEDINALWHITSCLEEHRHEQDDKINKLQKEIDTLHEEINKINVERHEK
tara:strand:+ start:801 stop:1025 length:225 start_codon:yes stop_codon:yes gene_type:complete